MQLSPIIIYHNVILLQDDETKVQVNKILDENVDIAKFEKEVENQTPLYSPYDNSTVYGQNFESLLVSIKIQGHSFSQPLLAFTHHWTALLDQPPLMDIFLNSSEFKLLRDGIFKLIMAQHNIHNNRSMVKNVRCYFFKNE